MPIVLVLLVVFALMFSGKGKGGTTPPGSGLPEITETRVAYRGRSIFVGKTPEAIAKPFRWRVAEANGDAVANATGWAATEAEAIGAAQLVIDGMPVIEPQRPTPPTPTPNPNPLEGGGAPVACESIVRDGGFTICLYPQGARWGYRATDAAGMPVATEGGFDDKRTARVAAWRMLAPMPTTLASVTRHGITIDERGNVTLGNRAAFDARALPVLQAELGKGETDPRGLVLALWSSIWPSINPLRVTVDGQSLATVAARVAPAIPNAQAMADAIFAAPNAGGWVQT